MSTDGASGPAATPAVPNLPAGGQRRRLVLAGTRGQVAAGRDFGRRALADWYAATTGDPRTESTADDVLLLISELLANALMHAGGPLDLVLHGTATTLRVEVTDADRTVPRPKEPYRAGAPGGHGLHIVGRLSDRWGVEVSEHGKTVWLEIGAARITSGA
ncbi:ATP-binding protein [Kitasatospora sp. CMC57]|uniref:ATP-binding protein n=1 Tax=Kitasatospora sp. CMC57 TaxID=3231513 RepID=A0AB33JXF1_9ACTN